MNSGLLPLFPLPNVLLYPKALLPLHVFEPRYLQLVKDLQKNGEDLLAMGVLEDGWDLDYFNTPPIHAIGGVGKILQWNEDADGNYNLLVQGLTRASFQEEPFAMTYRSVAFEAIHEIPVIDPEEDALLRRALRNSLQDFSDETTIISKNLQTGYLADILIVAMNLSMKDKYELFKNPDVLERGHAVLRATQQESFSKKSFGEIPEGGDSRWN
jgi:Lon protease-like protein